MDYTLLKIALMNKLSAQNSSISIGGPVLAGSKGYPAMPKIPKNVKDSGGLIQDQLKNRSVNSFTRLKQR